MVERAESDRSRDARRIAGSQDQAMSLLSLTQRSHPAAGASALASPPHISELPSRFPYLLPASKAQPWNTAGAKGPGSPYHTMKPLGKQRRLPHPCPWGSLEPTKMHINTTPPDF